MSVVAFPTPYPSFADKPLRILVPDLSARVAAVNCVRDLLHRAGAEIVSQDLLRGGNRPLVCIKAAAPGLRGVAQSIRLYGDLITAVINGVDVQWPHQAGDVSTH